MRRTAPLALIMAVSGLAMGVGANAAGADMLARGRELATARCSGCHATGEAGASNHPGVRPFRVIATRGSLAMLEAARRTGIIEGHDEMPEFAFERDDIEALLAYIASLAPAAARPGR